MREKATYPACCHFIPISNLDDQQFFNAPQLTDFLDMSDLNSARGMKGLTARRQSLVSVLTSHREAYQSSEPHSVASSASRYTANDRRT